MDDDDILDDAEWERWMGLTDAQQEAELAAAEILYEAATREWEARTPRPLQYAHHRRTWLDLCRRQRTTLYGQMFPDLARADRKRWQMGMWKLRWWYRTGTWPAGD